jgi:hypothetical protein
MKERTWRRLGLPGQIVPLYAGERSEALEVRALDFNQDLVIAAPPLSVLTYIYRPPVSGSVGTHHMRSFDDNVEKILRRMLEKKAYQQNMELNIVSFEGDLSFEDQVKLLQRSSITIGIHGAALTNTMFMPSGSALIEIAPHNFNLPNNGSAAVHYIQGGHTNLWYFQHRTIAEGVGFYNEADCKGVPRGSCYTEKRDQVMNFNEEDFSIIEEALDQAIAYVSSNFHGGSGVHKIMSRHQQ